MFGNVVANVSSVMHGIRSVNLQVCCYGTMRVWFRPVRRVILAVVVYVKKGSSVGNRDLNWNLGTAETSLSASMKLVISIVVDILMTVGTAWVWDVDAWLVVVLCMDTGLFYAGRAGCW